MKRYTFTLEETQEIKAAREKNRDKNVEKRLAALEMRAEGKQNKEIREITAAGQFDRLRQRCAWRSNSNIILNRS